MSTSSGRDHGAMAIAFRRATESDARAAADLWLRAREAAVGTIPPPVHDDKDVRAWFASHVVWDTELWLAEDAGSKLAGILVLDGQWLDQLYVEPTMTGRGVGSKLVELAKRARPDGLRLWTFASNVGAQRFTAIPPPYERHGFVAIRRTDGRDNEEGARTSSTSGASPIADRRAALDPTVLARGRPGRRGQDCRIEAEPKVPAT